MSLTLLAAAILVVGGAAIAQPRDANNPTCPSLSTMQFSDWKAMSFTLDTSSGHRVLIVDGGISLGDHYELEKAVAANAPVEEIVVRSPGGVALEGMRLGVSIRKLGIPTRIPPGWWCASACSFMFLGGPVRAIDEGGVYAVHMFSSVSQEKLQEQINQAREARGMSALISNLATMEQNTAELASDENDYMIRMGASRKLLTEVMYKQRSVGAGDGDNSTLRCLTPDEERRYNVVNVVDAPPEPLKPSSGAVRP